MWLQREFKWSDMQKLANEMHETDSSHNAKRRRWYASPKAELWKQSEAATREIVQIPSQKRVQRAAVTFVFLALSPGFNRLTCTRVRWCANLHLAELPPLSFWKRGVNCAAFISFAFSLAPCLCIAPAFAQALTKRPRKRENVWKVHRETLQLAWKRSEIRPEKPSVRWICGVWESCAEHLLSGNLRIWTFSHSAMAGTSEREKLQSADKSHRVHTSVSENVNQNICV